jgi:predicted dehydrogenase
VNNLRVAVIGAGHLGKIHARLLAEQKGVDLVAVADPSPAAQQQILDSLDTRTVSDFTKLVGEIDAAVIATPTRTHFDVASRLIEHGIHCLIEKPLTDSVSDAQELVSLADRHRCVVQVGHVEQFNPAIAAALTKIGTPKFVVANRLSGYTFRSTDIGVVHDLMIHDIDLVNSFFAGDLLETRAVGMSMFGHHEDMATARLQFTCGGVANLTASRCSFENERTLKIFGTTGFAHVDLATSKLTVVQVPDYIRDRQYDLLDTTPEQQAFIRENLFSKILPKQEIEIDKSNAILAEQSDWVSAIKNGEATRVSVEQGAQAVEIAESVLSSLAAHRWSQSDAATTGPFGIITANGDRRSVTPTRKAA